MRVLFAALLFATTLALSPLPAASATPASTDVQTYGAGHEGFQLWCKSTFSAVNFRYLSSEEVWIAMSDSYGPYPTQALAARAASKYLEFDPAADRMTVVIFRSNQRLAEATVTREH